MHMNSSITLVLICFETYLYITISNDKITHQFTLLRRLGHGPGGYAYSFTNGIYFSTKVSNVPFGVNGKSSRMERR